MEIWKPLANDYGSRYEVSSYGRIRSIDYVEINGRNIGGRFIKSSIDRNGYPRIRVGINNIKKSYRIHRLVACAFIENPSNLPEVNHKDGDKTNNNKSNLEWSTSSENQLHAIANSLKITPTGENSAMYRGEVLVFDLSGNLVDTLKGNKDMENKGYNFKNVSLVVTGKRKTHRNLIFIRN